MKKLLTLLLITMTMVLCLGACGGNTDDVSRPDEPEAVEENEEYDEEDYLRGDYTIVYFQSGPLILVLDNNKEGYNMGALDSSGDLVIPCKYDELDYLGKDRYLALEIGENDELKYGVLDFEGNEIIPCECSSIDPTSGSGLFCFLDGYKEPEGEFVAVHRNGSEDREYISIIDGRTVSGPEEGMMLTYDEEGMEAAEAAYNGEVDNITVPEEISNKYKDALGIWGIAYGCNECERFTNYICHYYVVSSGNDQIMIVDADGNEIGNGKVWAEVGYELGNGLIAVRKEPYGLWALIDSEGNEVTDYIFDVVIDMS